MYLCLGMWILLARILRQLYSGFYCVIIILETV